jgi:asparagine synthase (glutamine-hydrolysing)
LSAIGGLLFQQGKSVSRQDVFPLVQTLQSRGVDGVGIWCSGEIGLVHCAFHTTPESVNESLPNFDSASKAAITADARIDNRKDLGDKLGLEIKEMSDSQLILLSYSKWGKDCVEKLIGVFSFAIWDESEKTLFCARDCFGVRPFYYSHNESQSSFCFSSTLKSLLSLPFTVKDVNDNRIADYLTCGVTDEESTFYKDIQRLAPGSTLTIRNGDISVHKYYHLPDSPLTSAPLDDVAEEMRERFLEAIKCRMRSNGNLGSFLSGGIDSGSITSGAAFLLEQQGGGGKLPVVSGIFSCL